MEGNKRTIWIIVAAVLVFLCCCIVAAGLVAALFVARGPMTTETGFSRVTERTEQTYSVGRTPLLEVDTLAGSITVHSGEPGRIRVVSTKRAANSGRLNSIRIDVSHQDQGVRIRTWRDGNVMGDLAVEFEIYVPPGSRLDLSTAAGDITVNDIRGEISANTGAGTVQVRGAAARVHLETGAGDVNYQGAPHGLCTFRTRAGEITLRLPAAPDVEVDLNTGLGNIDLGGFVVDGDISRDKVVGVIGTGADATLVAQTAVGDITLTGR
jgi:hypothetical protein